MKPTVEANILRECFMFQRNCPPRKIFLITFGLVMLVAIEAQTQLGSRETKEWIQNLDRPERIAGLKIDKVLPLLKLKPGDKVADIGAGAGAFSLPLAKAVAPSGKVYAVDIDPGLLDYIAQKAKKENVENIQRSRGNSVIPSCRPVTSIWVSFMTCFITSKTAKPI